MLCYQGHGLLENRHGLVVRAIVRNADGLEERRAAPALRKTARTSCRRSIDADKAYNTTDSIASCPARQVTPHVAANDTRRGGSAIDGRTTRHFSYRMSQVVRKRIEEHSGWGKTVGRIRQTVFCELQRIDQQLKLTLTASNLARIARMPLAVPCGAAR